MIRVWLVTTLRRQGVLPSCRSGDSSGPQRPSDALAAMLSRLESSSRDRRYLRAQAGLSPEPPNTTAAFSPARSPSCPPTLRSPERQQTPIGFVDRVPWHCEPTSPSPYQRR